MPPLYCAPKEIGVDVQIGEKDRCYDRKDVNNAFSKCLPDAQLVEYSFGFFIRSTDPKAGELARYKSWSVHEPQND